MVFIQSDITDLDDNIILLDACHSGQSGYDLLEYASVKAVNLNNVIEELLNREPGVTVMTSSSGREYSYENPAWGHGAFTKAILEDRPIDIFNNGEMERDFTYIDDIVEGVFRLIDHLPIPDPNWSGDAPDSATSYCPWRLYNIGNNSKQKLMRYIEVLEECLGKTAQKNFMPMQAGDVPATYADVDDLVREIDFKPQTSIEEGISKFVDWYRGYYSK